MAMLPAGSGNDVKQAPPAAATAAAAVGSAGQGLRLVVYGCAVCGVRGELKVVVGRMSSFAPLSPGSWLRSTCLVGRCLFMCFSMQDV